MCGGKQAKVVYFDLFFFRKSFQVFFRLLLFFVVVIVSSHVEGDAIDYTYLSVFKTL